MPHLTQLLSIELSPRCNLGHVHTACPNRHPDRTANLDTSHVLDDATIVRLVKSLYRQYGFAGMVGFHYYSEPLLSASRLFSLVSAIKASVPEARFLLWTNGTLIPEDCDQFAAFDQIHVTDYTADGHPPRNLDALKWVAADVRVHPSILDSRLTAAGNSSSPCVRMFTEIAIDAWGYVHPCCYAWRGRDAIGNVMAEPLANIVAKWQAIRDRISGDRMSPGSPAGCLSCGMRTETHTSFVPEIEEKSRWHVAALKAGLPTQQPGVCFVHYKIPERRLVDHFRWNDKLYRSSRARVYVVTDREYEVPAYARCIVYDKPMPVFSLAATKNAAIQAALRDGCNPILSTDVDIAIPPRTWDRFLFVEPDAATIPNYRMVRTFDERNCAAPVDTGATGVVGMSADNWRKCPYDERFVGYGAEDGQLRLAIRLNRIQEQRDMMVWHIAHNPDASQVNVPGHGRGDAWNRDSINPDNFVNNRKLIQ